MSLTIDPAADDAAFPPHSLYVRPVALTILLLAEALTLTIRFDAPPGLDVGTWWGWLLENGHRIARVLLLALAAIIAFGGLRFRVRMRRAIEHAAEGHASWPNWLLAHGVSLAAFAVLASVVCDGALAASPRPGALVSALIVAGLATGVTWSAALLSPPAWAEVARRSARPIAKGASVAVVAFLASRHALGLWDAMAGATLTLARSMLRLVARDVTGDPGLLSLGVGGFKVQIADACSGSEGIGLVVAFLAAYLAWSRENFRWPRAYLLLPLGVAAIWLLNAARIASLILIGAWASPEVALGGFHSQAGWIAFLGVSLGLVVASRRLSFFAADLGDSAEATASNPSASFLGPFLAVMATAMVTGAFTSGFDPLYGLRALAGGAALWYFRRDLAGTIRGWSWAGVAIGVVAFGIWAALEPAPQGAGRSLASSVAGLPTGRALAWIALRVIGSVAIVPLVEELAFRGYLARRLHSVDFQSVPIGQFSWPSLLISSAAFGLLHGRWLAGMLVGLLYGLAMYRRGRLGDAVVAHAVTNALIAATVLATGDWTMWT